MPEPHLEVVQRTGQPAAKLGGFLVIVAVLRGFLFGAFSAGSADALPAQLGPWDTAS